MLHLSRFALFARRRRCVTWRRAFWKTNPWVDRAPRKRCRSTSAPCTRLVRVCRSLNVVDCTAHYLLSPQSPTAIEASTRMQLELKRINYVTPTKFLDLVRSLLPDSAKHSAQFVIFVVPRPGEGLPVSDGPENDSHRAGQADAFKICPPLLMFPLFRLGRREIAQRLEQARRESRASQGHVPAARGQATRGRAEEGCLVWQAVDWALTQCCTGRDRQTAG